MQTAEHSLAELKEECRVAYLEYVTSFRPEVWHCASDEQRRTDRFHERCMGARESERYSRAFRNYMAALRNAGKHHLAENAGFDGIGQILSSTSSAVTKETTA